MHSHRRSYAYALITFTVMSKDVLSMKKFHTEFLKTW